MGFGIIFIGYLFTVFDMGFIVNKALLVFVCKILCVVGYTVLLFGLYRFGRYSEHAKRAFYASAFLDLCMVSEAVLQGLWFFGAAGDQTVSGIRTYTFTVNAVAFALAQVLLMYAVFDIGKQTECDKVRKNGIRSVAATAAFCIINIASSFLKFGDFFDVLRYVLFIVLFFINAVTLYSAYRYICLDTELEAERAEALKERTFKKGK